MRLLHVSDFHGRVDWFDWLSKETARGRYDVCCLTGDLLDILPRPKIPLGEQIDFVRGWLESFAGCPLLICTGNHDWWSSDERPRGLPKTYDKAGWLAELPETVRVDFGAFEWGGLRFESRRWQDPTAFWPTDLDRAGVLLCHAPPDGLRTAVDLDGVGAGDFGVGAAVAYLPAGSLILSGHVHRPESWHDRVDRTHSFNPGRAADGKTTMPHHIVIDTKAGLAELRQGATRHGPVRLR